MRTLLYLLFVEFSLVIPGYAIFASLKSTRDRIWLRLCLGITLSMLVFGGLALLTYVLPIPHRAVQVLLWLLILAGTIAFVRGKLYRELWNERFLLVMLFLMPLMAYAFTSLTRTSPTTFFPDPTEQVQRNYETQSVKIINLAHTQANDNYIPYRQAQFIFNRSNPTKDSFIDEWGVHFFQRTPLMGSVSAGYFILFNSKPPIAYTWSVDGADPAHTYAKFEIIAMVLNSLLIIPGFYLLSLLFKRRAAALAILFVVPSQYFLFSTFYTWPKSLVAFFVLFSWLLLLQKRGGFALLAGAVSGFAYLTHDLAVLYIGASFLLLLFQKRFKDLLLFLAPIVLSMAPWLLISSVVFKKPSSFFLYPISTEGIPQPKESHQIIEKFMHTSVWQLIWIRLQSLFYLVSPYQLVVAETGQSWARRIWALGLYSVPGAVGVALIPAVVVGAVRRIGRWSFWVLAITPIILCTLIIGWPMGLGAMHFAQASVLLLIGLGCSVLVSVRWKAWGMIAYAFNCLQLGWLIAFSYNFQVLAWLKHPSDLVWLGIMGMIVLFCAWQSYLVIWEKPARALPLPTTPAR